MVKPIDQMPYDLCIKNTYGKGKYGRIIKAFDAMNNRYIALKMQRV